MSRSDVPDLPKRVQIINASPSGPGTVVSQTQYTVRVRMDVDGKTYLYGKSPSTVLPLTTKPIE